jgi:hypothetical protein
MYLALTVASTIMSVYSIGKIFITTKQLSATNEKVSLKNYTLLIHAALIVLNCCAVFLIGNELRIRSNPRFYTILLSIYVVLDFIVQLFICYICVKFGAIDSLNRFDCYLVDDGNGGYQIKFILRKSVPEAIGVPHAANEVNDEEEEVMY